MGKKSSQPIDSSFFQHSRRQFLSFAAIASGTVVTYAAFWTEATFAQDADFVKPIDDRDDVYYIDPFTPLRRGDLEFRQNCSDDQMAVSRAGAAIASDPQRVPFTDEGWVGTGIGLPDSEGLSWKDLEDSFGLSSEEILKLSREEFIALVKRNG